MDDIEALRNAKKALLRRYGKCAWFRGAGIASSKSGMVLRLNVDPTVDVEEGEIPDSFEGFEVDMVFIRSYKPRHG